MYRKSKRLHQVICLLLIGSFVSCKNEYLGNFDVIMCHYSNKKWPCFIKEDNGYYIIDNILSYKNGKLTSYQGCASEGLFVDNFEENGNYSTEDKQLKALSIVRKGDRVLYFQKSYLIIKERNDSVFVKTEKVGECYVFVGTIPTSEE